MESFLRSLSFCNSTTLEDVTYACMKILDWIYKASLSSNQLSYKDVENIGKGILYLSNCYKLFEEELPTRLLEQYPYFAEQVKAFFGNAPNMYHKSIAQIFEKVAQTVHGSEHIFTLESILNTPLELNETLASLEYANNKTANKSCSSLKMYTLVQKIFQLPNNQVDIAIDRMLNYIPFNIVGLVFCEPENSFYNDACCILAHKICEKLQNGSISEFFIRSLYYTSAVSQGGKEFYLLCLKNIDFKNGLCALFIRVLSYLTEKEIDFNNDIGQIVFEKHRINHVFYLIWAALTHLSPCKTDLYKQIVDVGLSSFFHILNKFERIYE